MVRQAAFKAAALALGSVMLSGTAYASDSFGRLTVWKSGELVSEASGGSVYLVSVDGYTQERTRITFRDVSADGWGTYAKSLQDGYWCVRSGSRNTCGWHRMNNDETNKYGTADGWRTSYLTEGRVFAVDYRAEPKICHHEPWYDPDDCNSAGWQYP